MIAIYYANRAEKSILDPVKNALDRINEECLYVDLSKKISFIEDDKNLSRVYDYVFNQLEDHPEIRAGIVIGDRREIMFASLAMFVKDVEVIQLAAGDLSDEISLVDDYFRHLITILSDKQVCFTKKSKQKSDKIRSHLNLCTDSRYIPNPTLSDLNLDNIERKNLEDYDLVLVHPQSLSYEETVLDSQEVCERILDGKKTFIIRGNRDKNYEILYSTWDKLSENSKEVVVYENLDKEQFIGLLSNCDRFITNSSCAFYEAPFFLNRDQIIKVGRRNKNREVAEYSKKDIFSSDKIAKFITESL